MSTSVVNRANRSVGPGMPANGSNIGTYSSQLSAIAKNRGNSLVERKQQGKARRQALPDTLLG
jgi:hypothetical protein